MPPFFSVIIPTYNRASILKRAVLSVLRQTYRDFELIIVDDGSTDSTFDLISSIVDDRIILLQQKNSGVCSARNYGILNSKGKYICFLDSDDEVLPEWLSGFRVHCTDEEIDIIFCDLIIIDQAGIKTVRKARFRYQNEVEDLNGLFLSGAFAISSGLIRVAGGFTEDLRYGEFTELNFRLDEMKTSRKFTYSAQAIYYKILHRDALYEFNRLNYFEFVFSKYPNKFLLNSSLFSLYLTNAGVASVRIGNLSKARYFFLKAFKIRPLRFKYAIRYLITLVPPIAKRIW